MEDRPYLSRLVDAVGRIDERRRVVDRGLTRPERWRGPTRKELCGRARPEERARVSAVFDRLADAAADRRAPVLDPCLLLDVHRQIHPSGGAFRTSNVTVGRRRFAAAIADVPALTERALERASDGVEPPALAAARLHLELLLIHPFREANGRTARLLSAYLLMCTGFRSTRLTAVEQHFAHHPARYGRIFARLAAEVEPDHDAALAELLSAMARRAGHRSA